MKKRIVATGLILAMTIGFSTITYAESNSTIKIDDQGNLVTEDISLEAFLGMAPGEEKIEDFVISNESNDIWDYYILQETIEKLESTNNASGGAYVFDLRVGDTFESSTSLLAKEVGGYDADGNASDKGLDDLNELSDNELEADGYTYLTQLGAGDTTHMYIYLKLEGEGNDNTNGQEYTNAVGQLQLSFKANSPHHKGQPSIIERVTIRYKKIIKYVKTGDNNLIFLYGGLLVVAIGMICFASRKVLKGKK